jgi:hypothetical protein
VKIASSEDSTICGEPLGGMFGSPALLDLELSGLQQARMIDGDRRMRRNGGYELLGLLRKDPSLIMAEEQPTMDLAGARDDGHRQIADNRQVTLRHAEMGSMLP